MPPRANGNSESKVWSGAGKSQDELMLKDECILVNYLDEVIGHNNKYNCHKFAPGQPRGLLHRAFSVLLFDAENRLLLQQRASSKITFPDIWANTCCSHPLFGMQPNELDMPEAIAQGDPKGVKAAAVRKLGHELGIPAAELEESRFKFLTRVHYWAADVKTYGPEAIWGEHEIDHILLYRLKPGEKLTLKPCPDEVQATRWLSSAELKQAFAGQGDVTNFSPWFRVIAEKLLDPWWQDLDAALTTDKYVDTKTIHRFDTPKEFHGGLGRAGPYLDAVAEAEAAALKEGGEEKRRKVVLEAGHDDNVIGFVGRGKLDGMEASAGGLKQGGYGKVPTHKTSKIDQLMRPLEVASAFRLKCTGLLENNMKDSGDPDVEFCDDMLGKVSRSFAAVIRQLPKDLSIDICIFYLVLRALDTVEDDMEAYKGRESEKQKELVSFAESRLSDTKCSIRGVGYGDEKTLVEQFGKVARVFLKLPAGSRDVIKDITRLMGAGMAEYVSADLAQGTKDQAAYDRYCHMVAGLVGEGLTRIFIARGCESKELSGQGERVWPFCANDKSDSLGLANSMGLFLQKTNIIRDYLEDYVDGRAFWPQTVWKQYACTNDLGEFAQPTAYGAGSRLAVKVGGEILAKGVGVQALMCLNDLVADALELVPDALEYLERVKTPSIYRFCAIPQVMAIATLKSCFDNPQVFTGVVKIRKGEAARLIVACCDGPDAVHSFFSQFAREILDSVESRECVGADGAIGKRLSMACKRILERTQKRSDSWNSKRMQKTMAAGAITAIAVSALFMRGMGSDR
mmetsp:Transcript_18141/g.31828  ORF Transcript_18141/g.31828 Transcript_18141/m.31828 type:complete len:796 (-) Transcript_18141:83-2470(-)